MARPWKRRLRPARFRKATFNVDESVYDAGRRGTTHEFPGRDVPYREDLGRKARVYKVEGFIVGPNYISGKNKLIAKLEEPGSGELIHPYFGRVKVSVENFSVSESTRDGGFVKFSMTFVESGEVRFPKSENDSGFNVENAGGLLDTSSQGAFGAVFSVLGQAEYAVDSVTDKVNSFADDLDDILAQLNGPAGAVADLALAIKNLKAVAGALVTTPATLASEISRAFSLLLEAGDPSDVLKHTRKMYTFGSTDAAIPTTTSSRTKQQTNLTALNNLVKNQATVATAKAAIQIDFLTTQDAEAARIIVTDQIDTLLDTLPSESTGDDENFSNLQQLRAELVSGLPSNANNLANVTTYTPISTENSLALAYDLYGSLELEDDLVSRNDISHPGFLSADKDLEVLDRG